MAYCMFCENEADYIIEGSGAPICRECKEIYEAGQESPKDVIVESGDDNECGEEYDGNGDCAG